ncbi:hypothetical protein BDZ85DRAFT_95324 [Elsinoe ampelina]|uniref:Uncharacterized protein n=1 Tax=Elsinoe ampelina TaxID=302913 RepID=A0A6A6GDZ7_9PEZI|nr:hypothetical protein BDZ85DRAFT_95324 [Elsinoe ampelina]
MISHPTTNTAGTFLDVFAALLWLRSGSAPAIGDATTSNAILLNHSPSSHTLTCDCVKPHPSQILPVTSTFLFRLSYLLFTSSNHHPSLRYPHHLLPQPLQPLQNPRHNGRHPHDLPAPFSSPLPTPQHTKQQILSPRPARPDPSPRSLALHPTRLPKMARRRPRYYGRVWYA